MNGYPAFNLGVLQGVKKESPEPALALTRLAQDGTAWYSVIFGYSVSVAESGDFPRDVLAASAAVECQNVLEVCTFSVGRLLKCYDFLSLETGVVTGRVDSAHQ